MKAHKTQRAPRRPSVALLIESSNAYARGLLRGISAYVREHESWTVFFKEMGRGNVPPSDFRHWHGSGIIARIENQQLARIVTEKNVAVVDVSAARLVDDCPWVETDDERIARTAFEHLRERGLTRFAYCGAPQFNWSNWRRDHFTKIVRAAGFDCDVYESSRPRRTDWRRELHQLSDWVGSLPRPVGIMACFDMVARLLLDACRQRQLAVPEQIAVVGVDNDEVICDLCQPRLSSVIPDTFRTGYMAAQLLDSLMSHRKVRVRAHRIPPLGVKMRASSNVVLTRDTLVIASLQYIREHACDGVTIQDVASRLGVSRKTLDRRFVDALGHTPHREASRVRIERAKQLLTQSRLPLRTVADRAGFTHVEYFSVAFKRETGASPAEYRRVGGEQIIDVHHSPRSNLRQDAYRSDERSRS